MQASNNSEIHKLIMSTNKTVKQFKIASWNFCLGLKISITKKQQWASEFQNSPVFKQQQQKEKETPNEMPLLDQSESVLLPYKNMVLSH